MSSEIESSEIERAEFDAEVKPENMVGNLKV